jgi:hypothetical protein
MTPMNGHEPAMGARRRRNTRRPGYRCQLQQEGAGNAGKAERSLPEQPSSRPTPGHPGAVAPHVPNPGQAPERWTPDEDSQWLGDLLSEFRVRASVKDVVMARLRAEDHRLRSSRASGKGEGKG